VNLVKKYITPTSIIFLWGLILLTISEWYYDYTRYFLYLSIIVIVPIMIINLKKQRKEDQRNDTNVFKNSILRMLFMAVVIGILFFLAEQNHM